MKPVYLCGRGLASTLGLDLNSSLAGMQNGGVATQPYTLPGMFGVPFPYYTIPYEQSNKNERARALIKRVADEAGAQHARNGALFIATSSFEIGAVEQGSSQIDYDYRVFINKISGWLGWAGPVYLISTACTSSLNALIAAHALLKSGATEDALVLGIELENKMTLGGFAALQLLSPTSSQPFGAQRDGLVLGEAIAALRLSTRENSPWKMLGGANVVDGNQPTSASASAVVSMYQRALSTCGLSAAAIDLIKVQAAGSPSNDAIEAQGLLAVFAHPPALVSLKAALGHTMGASGAAEIAVLSACLEQGVWPKQTDDLDQTLGVKLATEMPESINHLLATILGFGGSHATVVLEHT